MQKLELLISSLSNADELAFKKKICKPFILEFIQLFLKRVAALEIPKDFQVKKCRCHFHRWYMHFRSCFLPNFNISRYLLEFSGVLLIMGSADTIL